MLQDLLLTKDASKRHGQHQRHSEEPGQEFRGEIWLELLEMAFGRCVCV